MQTNNNAPEDDPIHNQAHDIYRSCIRGIVSQHPLLMRTSISLTSLKARS